MSEGCRIRGEKGPKIINPTPTAIRDARIYYLKTYCQAQIDKSK